MTHPSDDILLQRVLEALPAEEARHVEDHLAECPACKGQVDKISAELRTIVEAAQTEPVALLPSPPRPRSWSAIVVMRAAAILVIGFLLGYASGRLTHHEPRTIVAQQFRPVPAPVVEQSFLPVEGVDLAVRQGF